MPKHSPFLCNSAKIPLIISVFMLLFQRLNCSLMYNSQKRHNPELSGQAVLPHPNTDNAIWQFWPVLWTVVGLILPLLSAHEPRLHSHTWIQNSRVESRTSSCVGILMMMTKKSKRFTLHRCAGSQLQGMMFQKPILSLCICITFTFCHVGVQGAVQEFTLPGSEVYLQHSCLPGEDDSITCP